MIDLEAVVALRAVATNGSVAAAADALGFTPSAVSQQIKRLERGTRVALLERAGRGVVLTDAGRHLVTSSATVLADLERIEADLHLTGRASGADGAAARRITGEVRIGAFSTAVRGLLVDVLPRLREEHPELRVPLRESEPWETIALVASGQRDLGIVHRWGGVALAMPDHLVETPLFTDVADVILRREHPLADRAELTPLDLADEQWIATFDSTICRQWLRRLFDGVSNAPRIVHESMEFENHLELVRAGLGVALVPRMGRPSLHPDLVAVPTVRPASTRGVSAVHRRSQADSPALQAVLDAVRSGALGLHDGSIA
ncbi:DNA-binding transcriptional LysR family regulator [Agromyces flavus]|uniref:DNA-binding transcriptional LysR family regulator n=1 Tax=Agromyces flavus TaxID=589382 RepID=A0A1H1W3X2_9MICO|nr:LysR family transcriptional regulator [Agromyces flavus]MCP2366086.1 DNA-binding transcriptional LysR family regulator [Agromyces flavus]GGI43975.1 LysR family transcriptional regulator [Agromyces flavus]SDS91998.1 DNA-binding transcriptional regulator, LysR family [Agromyces flavus]